MVPNPNLIEAALAYATEVEGIETAIYPVGRSLGKTREPLRVAEEYAMLDAISDGRLIAGFPVGLAYDANINNGIPPIETRPRFDENLELVLRAWRDAKPFAWNGKFSQHAASQPLAQAPAERVRRSPSPESATRSTMEFCLQRGFGFNYFGWFGFRVTGPAHLRSLLGSRRPARPGQQPLPHRLLALRMRRRNRREGRGVVCQARRVFLPEGHRQHPDAAADAARGHRHQGPGIHLPRPERLRACTRRCARPASRNSSMPAR